MVSNKQLSPESVVVISSEQLSSEVSGETVILNLKSGIYYGLNQTGAVIWNLLQQPRKVEALRNKILEEYDVEPAQCDRDLEVILQEMLGAELIEIVEED